MVSLSLASGARARSTSPIWMTLLLAAALLLSGCSRQEVYGSLSEAQANELIAALSDAGIGAEKARGDDKKWTVEVSQGDFSKAVETLRAVGLPREEHDSLGTVFKKEGFNSSPLEERARLNYGLSQELEQTISQIDGVVQARVHLTMPEADPLSREAKPSAASVFVKYRTGFDVRSHTGEIKSFVTNSIEGLTYEKVSVFMVPAKITTSPKPSGISLGGDMLWRIIVALIALSVLGVAARTMWKSRRARKAEAKSEILEAQP